MGKDSTILLRDGAYVITHKPVKLSARTLRALQEIAAANGRTAEAHLAWMYNIDCAFRHGDESDGALWVERMTRAEVAAEIMDGVLILYGSEFHDACRDKMRTREDFRDQVRKWLALPRVHGAEKGRLLFKAASVYAWNLSGSDARRSLLAALRAWGWKRDE